ncbi:hypothetical protein HMPREF9374_1843 [Desmospora sp. 8437]|nr:hypothetical protein HMPREF9374_1843 [Desmospora sp. 8437]
MSCKDTSILSHSTIFVTLFRQTFQPFCDIKLPPHTSSFFHAKSKNRLETPIGFPDGIAFSGFSLPFSSIAEGGAVTNV